jgi:hypothetical protein
MIDVGYVDAAGIGRRLFIFPGRSSCLFKTKKEYSR